MSIVANTFAAHQSCAPRTTDSYARSRAQVYCGNAEGATSGSRDAGYGHFTSGGRLERMELTLPPVFRPKIVPRS
jgi:hypothetical protein